MISILVCSIAPNDFDKLELNISETIGIGIKYEVLKFDNRLEKKGITSVYNYLASQAKYTNLLFIHEDISFGTTNWGEIIVELLQRREFGVVGIAGSSYLPSMPSGWYLPFETCNNVYIKQGFKYSNKAVRFDNQGEDLTPVFLLDGVFLAIRKEVFTEFCFNEKLTGFHAYDVDICQRISTRYQNIFTNRFEIFHQSEGKVDRDYFEAILHSKLEYLNFKYGIRNRALEFAILKQLYFQLRCYYDKPICKAKLRPYIKIKYLGIKGLYSYFKMLRNDK